MVVFIDTSSLLKHYVQENGSEKVDAYYVSQNTLVIAPITPVEVRAALKRKRDDKGISEATYQKALSLWEEDEALYTLTPFDSMLIQRSIDFISEFSLKTLDAIQTAAAALSKTEVVLCSDKKMFTALTKAMPEKAVFI